MRKFVLSCIAGALVLLTSCASPLDNYSRNVDGGKYHGNDYAVKGKRNFDIRVPSVEDVVQASYALVEDNITGNPAGRNLKIQGLNVEVNDGKVDFNSPLDLGEGSIAEFFARGGIFGMRIKYK